MLTAIRDGAEIVREAFRSGITPDPIETIWQWAERYRVLTTDEGAAEPGPYRISRTPYLREIAECLSPSSPVREVVLMKPVQIGASELANNLIGHTIHRAPRPIMIVQPTDETARDYSALRINPFVAATPELSRRVTEDRDSGGSKNKLKLKRFPGGYLVVVGAVAPAPLRSKPVRILIGDEREAWPVDVGGEGDPWKLARDRTTTHLRHKLFQLSTPAMRETSRIEREYLRGDQRRYFVPCARCGAEQELYFQRGGRYGLVWEPKRHGETALDAQERYDGAHYVCEHCGGTIEHAEKLAIVQAGEWRPTCPEKIHPRLRTYQINALYSPWKRWASVAQEWEEAQGDVLALKRFVNCVLGETFEDRGAPPDWEELYRRRSKSYQLGSVPDGALVLTGSVDVQADRLELLVVGWGDGLRSWVVDYRQIMGAVQDPRTGAWAELSRVLDETWPALWFGGLRLPLRRLAVDAGYETSTVYQWARLHTPDRVMVVMGQDSSAVPLGVATAVEVTEAGRRVARGLKRFPVGTSLIKSQLYGWLRAKPPLHEGEPYPGGWVEFPEMHQEFFEQLCSERLTWHTDRRGYRKALWHKDRERNEALDLYVYAIACSHSLQLPRYTPEHWQRLREELIARPQGQEERQQEGPRSVLDEWRRRRLT